MRFSSTIAAAGLAATAQATWHGEWKFPDGIKGPKDDGGKEVGPGYAPPDGYLPIYHPPHHDVVIDDCDKKDDDDWHWVHPGKDHHEDDYKWTTSTITATHISTVIDCGDKDCYGGGGKTQYTTVTIPQTTTICPVPVAPEPTPEKPEEPEQPYPEPPVETHPVPTPEPPVETQPVHEPEPPVETYPVPAPEPPVETQPVHEPEPPVETQPVHEPEPPVETQPVHEPEPPVEEPPVETQPGYEEPPVPSAPVEEPPVESEPIPVPAPPPTSIGTVTRPIPSATEGLEPVPTAAAANVRVGGAVLAAAVAAAFL
ncbi:hypothetical protein ACHAQF_006390 [Verticillium nonalfalfae]